MECLTEADGTDAWAGASVDRGKEVYAGTCGGDTEGAGPSASSDGAGGSTGPRVREGADAHAPPAATAQSHAGQTAGAGTSKSFIRCGCRSGSRSVTDGALVGVHPAGLRSCRTVRPDLVALGKKVQDIVGGERGLVEGVAVHRGDVHERQARAGVDGQQCAAVSVAAVWGCVSGCSVRLCQWLQCGAVSLAAVWGCVTGCSVGCGSAGRGGTRYKSPTASQGSSRPQNEQRYAKPVGGDCLPWPVAAARGRDL